MNYHECLPSGFRWFVESHYLHSHNHWYLWIGHIPWLGNCFRFAIAHCSNRWFWTSDDLLLMNQWSSLQNLGLGWLRWLVWYLRCSGSCFQMPTCGYLRSYLGWRSCLLQYHHTHSTETSRVLDPTSQTVRYSPWFPLYPNPHKCDHLGLLWSTTHSKTSGLMRLEGLCCLASQCI